MSEPKAWVIQDLAGERSFVVVGETGWLSFIARWTTFPEPRLEVAGLPVLIPRDPETFETLTMLLAHGALSNPEEPRR